MTTPGGDRTWQDANVRPGVGLVVDPHHRGPGAPSSLDSVSATFPTSAPQASREPATTTLTGHASTDQSGTTFYASGAGGMNGVMTNRIDQPRDYDLVGNPILIGGVGTGFEATLQYRVTEGHDEVTGNFMVGGGTGEHAQFQLQVDVGGAAFTLDRLFVQVFEISAEDGSEIHVVTVPVIYGPRIVPGYIGYREHTVVRGDTLSAIARSNYGDASLYQRIVRANPTQISDPNLIFPGQVLKVPIGS